MSFRKLASAFAFSMAATSLFAADATAQRNGPELTVGVAAVGSETYGGESSYTYLHAPAALLRAAFYVNDMIAIEPQISVDTWSGEDESATTISLGVFVPIYLNSDKGQTGFYVAPGAGITMYSQDDEDSASQTFFAAEAGKKFRISESTALRLAAQYYMEAENDDFFEYSNISLMLGLSVFLK